MATITTQHWKDTAIERATIITDAWEVVKAWTGRAAEWILFLCMIANIIEILVHVSLLFSDIILGIQVVTLDIAGFGLMSIAQNARVHGDEQGAKRATHTAYLLITIMLLTVLLFTLGLLVPSVRPFMDIAEKGLILVRVGMTVLYGHILHSLNRVSTVAPRKIIDTLQDELTLQRQQAKQEISALHTRYQHEIAHLTEQHQQAMNSQKNDLQTIQQMLADMQKSHQEITPIVCEMYGDFSHNCETISSEFETFFWCEYGIEHQKKETQHTGSLSLPVVQLLEEQCGKENESFSFSENGETPHEFAAIFVPHTHDIASEQSASQAVSPDVSRGKYVMTYEEASASTGYSVKYLKSKVNTGEIEVTSSGKLKVKSLEKMRRK